MYSVLDPANLCGMELRNRFVRSATWDATGADDGSVTDLTLKIYDDLGAGGVGLVITASMFISPDGKGGYGEFGIHSDAMLPGLISLVDACQSHGTPIVAQIYHAGGDSYLTKQGIVVLVPSVIGGNPLQRALTEDDIECVLEDFGAAAIRARDAGFDAVQLHGAHGYLISQFLSPLANRRDDRWGGSLENRLRFPVEVVRRARKALGPDYPVIMKLGILDGDRGGLTLDEGLACLQAMADAGLDAVEISNGIGTGSRGSIRVFKNGGENPYFRHAAAEAKRKTSLPVMLVGGIRCLETAEEIVSAGDADYISLCRPLIREPGLIARWESGDRSPALCISCNKCLTQARKGQPLRCMQEAPRAQE